MGRVQVPSDSCVGRLVARKRSRTEACQLPHAESETAEQQRCGEGLRLHPTRGLTNQPITAAGRLEPPGGKRTVPGSLQWLGQEQVSAPGPPRALPKDQVWRGHRKDCVPRGIPKKETLKL